MKNLIGILLLIGLAGCSIKVGQVCPIEVGDRVTVLNEDGSIMYGMTVIYINPNTELFTLANSSDGKLVTKASYNVRCDQMIKEK